MKQRVDPNQGSLFDDLPRPGGHLSLAALIAEQYAAARAVQISDEQLEAWYRRQLAEVDGRQKTLGTALAAGNADPALKDPASPKWKKWHALEAKYHYVSETLTLLRQRKHLLACPNHGVGGASPDDAEGLSLRGLLDDTGPLSWTRYCEPCALTGPISTRAQQLQRQHEEGLTSNSAKPGGANGES